MHHLGVTLEQARAFDALARCGTFAAAATELRKNHTSILHALKTLEGLLGFAVLDRSGYRTRVTPRGARVLEGCRALLEAEARLSHAVVELRAGWEPSLCVVFDGIVPIDPLLRAVGELARERVPTRIDVRAEFLAGVEDTFERLGADLMIAVLPPRLALPSIALPTLPASLVVHVDHPLAQARKVDVVTLRQHLLLTVRGSDPRLELPTATIEAHSTVHLNDFASKRSAILAGIGYGWLPDVLIDEDLARGRLVRVRWTRSSRHRFHPRLYHRSQLGPAARRLVGNAGDAA